MDEAQLFVNKLIEKVQRQEVEIAAVKKKIIEIVGVMNQQTDKINELTMLLEKTEYENEYIN